MRGMAVPTIVWSSAASKSASMVPATTAVVWIVDACHQAVALEVIDEPRDVARRDVELVGQFTQWQLVVGRGGQREQNMETTLTQAVLLGPPVHQLPG